MATLVCFHAHPDDESISTGGVMAKAAAEGHRVVLVVATKGEHGEVVPGVLGVGEPLGPRRAVETERSAEILGAARLEFLGYVDSGMPGTDQNDGDGSFWRADPEEAAARLAEILLDERADVLTVYDDHGGYGHPDHIQVHRVGVRAAELAGTPLVYEATMNRDHMRRLQERARAEGVELPSDAADPDEEPVAHADTFGTPEAELTTAVDVRLYLAQKRASMRAHASQIAEESFFLALPDEAFAEAFGTEWFRRRDLPSGIVESDLFQGLGSLGAGAPASPGGRD